MTTPLSAGAKVVAGAFLVSGTLHLARPRTYEPLMPSWVPSHREVIIASGAVELVCAAGLLAPPTRRVAGLASAALLVAVFPGNVQMALDALQGENRLLQVGTLARLPLQWPMIRAMLRTARAD